MPPRRAPPTQPSPQLHLAFLLGLGALVLLMGGAVLLMSLGVIEPDDPPNLFGRVVAFVFGLVVTGVGAKMLVTPFLLMAHAAGARDPFSALVLGWYGLLDRIDLRSVGSAALLAPLALAYWRALHGEASLGWSQDALVDVVVIEFLVIHGFPFVVIAASFARLPDRWPSRGGWAALALLIALYCAFAWGAGGALGVADLLYLMLPNVLAFARRDAQGVRITAAMRWVVQFVSLVAIAALLDERTLRGDGNLRIGLVYFSLHVFVELFRISEIPLDLASAWLRVPLQKRRTLQALQPGD